MPILNSLISWINTIRLNQIKEFSRQPAEIQQEQLMLLLNKARDTEYGKLYGFKSIHGVKAFQERVPITIYDDLKPWIERMIAGEKDILWPNEVKWFAKSSGTTNDKSKFIPVSKSSLEDCHYQAAKDNFTLFMANVPDTKVFTGKSLTLGGSHQISSFSDKTHIGDLSAIYIQNTPFLADMMRTPEASIALISEFEEKIKRIGEVSVKENVTSLLGVPSWNLVLLKHILKVTGKKTVGEVWPNLEVFVHGGISFEPYRQQFIELMGIDHMKYQETYNASEGFFGIQSDLTDKSMLLMLDYGIFYEFVAATDIDKPNPKVYTIEEVELHKNYAIVITTNGGLWRYMIGDTIKFVSKYPYKFVISGRTKHFINAFGEELIVDNAIKGLSEACKATGAIIKDYTAAPVYMTQHTKGRHQWLIEFEKDPNNIDQFKSILDQTLQDINSDYEAKRHRSVTLDGLEIIRANEGLFLGWMKQRGKLGGQNKVPRLPNNRDYIDELLKMNHQLTESTN